MILVFDVDNIFSAGKCNHFSRQSKYFLIYSKSFDNQTIADLIQLPLDEIEGL
ncbi:MAG: hypothetical protein PUC50_05280 [Bacteroidales bacterium]|nr:hypothetical protein [Bacteroidales bacterium]